MSIATKGGDKGQTSLVGNVRVSKASARVEAYGAVDELNSSMGFARSICEDAEVRELAKSIQRELFAVGSALATPQETEQITASMLDRLTAEVHRIEAMEGVIGDWTIPGEHAAAAAFDVARTVCRRAERRMVALTPPIDPVLLRYINRMSDLLFVLARVANHRGGLPETEW